MLDKHFSHVLIIQISPNAAENFSGDSFVIRSSIHTTRTFTAMPAGISMRPPQVWDVAVCLCLDNSEYQPKQSDMNRLELDL